MLETTNSREEIKKTTTRKKQGNGIKEEGSGGLRSGGRLEHRRTHPVPRMVCAQKRSPQKMKKLKNIKKRSHSSALAVSLFFAEIFVNLRDFRGKKTKCSNLKDLFNFFDQQI